MFELKYHKSYIVNINDETTRLGEKQRKGTGSKHKLALTAQRIT